MHSSPMDFHIRHYAYDGELLGSAVMKGAALSSRWLAVTDSLLDAGPILRRQLGEPLKGYALECAAGMCWFEVGGLSTYFGVLLRPRAEKQNQRLLEVFCAKLQQAEPVVIGCADPAQFIEQLRQSPERPLFIVVNWLNLDVPELDRQAMFQLAYHFAGSYFRWHEETS